MIYRLSILLLACLWLTACSTTPVTSPSEPQTSSEESLNNERLDIPAEEQKTVIIESETLISDGVPTSHIETPDDLLTRLRQGLSFPEFESPHIQKYEEWNAKHPTFINDLLARAEPFLYYIIEELDKRDMPLDLALLPAVESGFKPAAKSKSAAAGLWQFIPSTGRHYGLNKSKWYDGRLDLIAATNAALDYLSELNAMFDGDWLLTLAAYNGGQGTTRRAIANNKRKGLGTSYSDLDLREETELYAPKLYALRNLIRNPEKFGLTLPHIANQAYFEIIALPGQIDLLRFSSDSGIDIEELRHLNAAHKKTYTGPRGPHRLLIPIQAKHEALATLDRISKLPARQIVDHQIQPGETLSSIARRYDVSVSEIQKTNNLDSSNIRAGKTLAIPSVYQARDFEPENKKVVHKVSAGDTLWSIARRYRVKVSELLSWNSLSSTQILSLNQSVLVYLN